MGSGGWAPRARSPGLTHSWAWVPAGWVLGRAPVQQRGPGDLLSALSCPSPAAASVPAEAHLWAWPHVCLAVQCLPVRRSPITAAPFAHHAPWPKTCLSSVPPSPGSLPSGPSPSQWSITSSTSVLRSLLFPAHWVTPVPFGALLTGRVSPASLSQSHPEYGCSGAKAEVALRG